MYVVTEGLARLSALGRSERYGRFRLEPYTCPTGVSWVSQDEVPDCTPTLPERESVVTVARGKPCTGIRTAVV